MRILALPLGDLLYLAYRQGWRIQPNLRHLCKTPPSKHPEARNSWQASKQPHHKQL
jgi:hypothetical protein